MLADGVLRMLKQEMWLWYVKSGKQVSSALVRQVNRASSNGADMPGEAGTYKAQLIGLYADDRETME